MWRIYNKKAVYIPVDFPTEEEANKELIALLAPYPPESKWRQRLTIKKHEKESLQKEGDPPYGWRLRHKEVVPNKTEQANIKLIHKLRDAGWSDKEVAASFNGKKLKPRYGSRWTSELIESVYATKQTRVE